MRFEYLLVSPRRGESNKYTKRMIYKKTVQNIRYSCFRRVHFKFLYNSIFDFTAKSLVTITVVITRVPLFMYFLFLFRDYNSRFRVYNEVARKLRNLKED